MNDAWRATAYLSLFYYMFGFQLPYLPVWLEKARGLNGTQISAVIFGALLARIIVGPLISTWADAKTSRAALTLLAVGGFVGYLALNFSNHPIILSAVGFCVMSVVHAIMPLSEASLVLSVGKGIRPNFGEGRGIASVLFVLGVFSGGLLMERYGVEYLVPAITCLFVAQILIGLCAPRISLGVSDNSIGFGERFKRGFRQFRKPVLFLLLIASACIQATHAFYYGFSTVIWEKQGFSGQLISLMWITGVVLEIAFLTFSARLLTWLTPERLILLGGIAGVIRWTVLGFSPSALSILLVQNLHGLTFAATFIGCVTLIQREVDKESQALTLSILASVIAAVTGLFGLMSGILYDWIGAMGYWWMAGLAGIGTLFACLLMLRIRTRLYR
ncbi:MFS transporter [Hirschia litorea]|uniref:MFS transporter n=1 Tax=Hirschia litorea TaxID=1199156 RepID=A0ABW2ILT4_9PROT